MFLTNVLVVMRTWADSQQQFLNTNPYEDWDAETTIPTHPTIADKMKTSAYDLFLTIVDYLQSDRMSADVQFDMWKRIVTNEWTINEKV